MDISKYNTAGDYLKSIGKRYKDTDSAEKKIYNKILSARYRERTPNIAEKERTYFEEHKEQHNAGARRRYQERKAVGVTNTWFYHQKTRTGEQGTFEEVVGCTPEELTEHIVSMFQEGMTWDNWGKGKGKTKWHIDHITPIKDGGTTHYTNLQPLWCVDNLRKAHCQERNSDIL